MRISIITSLLMAAAFSVAAQGKPTNDIACTAKKWSLKGNDLTLKGGGEACGEQTIILNKPIAKAKDDGELFSVLADIAKIASYQEQLFSINGKPFSGMLLGVQKKSGKIDTLLEVNFHLGQRSGESFVRTKEGVLITIPAIEKEPIIDPIKPVVPVDEPVMVKKPVIYLYPTTAQTVNVQVDFKGELAHTYPKYPTQGWTVLAQADGTLLDEKTNKTYYNLFWEGESAYQYSLNTGFVVAAADVADFLDDALEKLGLNRREANEFITFWLPEMEKNAYNLVHFSTKEYSEQANLTVTPKPDTEIRVFMVYQPLTSPITVTPQTLSAPARKGFTLVEWGGKCQPQPKF